MWDFLVWVVCEKECKDSRHHWSHVLSTWLECEESWQMVIVSFHECLASKAFPRDTRETFCFSNLSYLIHSVSTHTIYTHIIYICWEIGRASCRERVWRLKTNWRSKEFSWIAREKPSCEVSHELNTWLECEESWQMVTTGFQEYFTSKAFPRDTRETFCFAILSYLIHHVSTHTIYTIITHILRGVIFKEKTLDITLES